jgi:hypothetical protein
MKIENNVFLVPYIVYCLLFIVSTTKEDQCLPSCIQISTILSLDSFI